MVVSVAMMGTCAPIYNNVLVTCNRQYFSPNSILVMSIHKFKVTGLKVCQIIPSRIRWNVINFRLPIRNRVVSRFYMSTTLFRIGVFGRPIYPIVSWYCRKERFSRAYNINGQVTPNVMKAVLQAR